MINFRYHIVSLMAVFLALAVGIAAGVSIGPSVEEGLQQQAEQDRQQVTNLRAELDRRNALDQYRQTFDEETGGIVTANELGGARVAVVAMPDAPGGVVTAVRTAVIEAGGNLVREVTIADDVFDPTKTADVDEALKDFLAPLDLTADSTAATKVGTALGYSVANRQVADRDASALSVGRALGQAGLATISDDGTAQAELVIVVSAEAVTPPTAPTELTAHVELQLALKARAAVVVAGPNSETLEGTDVLTIRTTSAAADQLSTVDVADLSSGVVTAVLAGKEQLLGRHGHYGALTRAQAVLPDLPVR